MGFTISRLISFVGIISANMWCLLFILIHFASVLGDVDVPVVRTTSGLVTGVYEQNEDGEHFLYMGIPYGSLQPHNMFGDPLPAKPWQGVLLANDESIMCPQKVQFSGALAGTADCLRLNVYRPAFPKSQKPLPVYFFIHGGQNRYGIPTRYQWGPEMLTAKDIIVITINYRTGIFGFLCLDIPEVPGNAGFKDLFLGLRWVRDNIKAFGGDPNSVTLGGSSSGATMVEWFITSKPAKGLFHRIILESGSVVGLGYDPNKSTEYIKQVALDTGFVGSFSIKNTLNHLQNLTTNEIVVATEALDLGFGGCLEKEFIGVERFAYEHPRDVIGRGDFEPYNVLTGFNSDEGVILVGAYEVSEQNTTMFDDITSGFYFASETEKDYVQELIRRFYFGDETISESTKAEMIRMYSDTAFIYPVYRSMNYYARRGCTVYFYEFAYDGLRNYYKRIRNFDVPGASHADEVGYIFRQDEFYKQKGIPLTPNDARIARYMTTMFTNFVKYGNPTPQVTENTPVIWEPVHGKETNYLLINSTLKMLKEPFKERMTFLELLYYAFYDKLKHQNNIYNS